MAKHINRRHFAGMGIGGLSGMLLTRNVSAKSDDNSVEPFFDQYYRGIMRIFTGLRDTQTPLIEREMATAWERMKQDGTIYSQITSGHFPTAETALDRTGQPGVLAFLPRNADDGVYAKLTPHDMIVTNTINLGNIEARKRGIRVVAVTVNYYPFSETPPDEGYQIEYDGKILKIEDTADVTINSQMPWHNGLVRTPEIEFPILPSSGIAQAAVYWMCAAQLAGLKAGKGKKAGSWARTYIDTCITRAERIATDRPKYERVAGILADRVMGGGRWYVFGNHALVSDAIAVANGPMVTSPYQPGEVRDGDIVLIGAYNSDNAEEIDVARECRKKGAYVVALAPLSTDGDSSGERLYKEADVTFDTQSPESWGVVEIEGLERKMCPTTGTMADLAMWLLFASWTAEMSSRGSFPYFWKGIFMNGGSAYNSMVRPYRIIRGW